MTSEGDPKWEMSHGRARISTDRPHVSRINSLVMASSPCHLKHSDLTDKIIGVFYDVYNELGHGFWSLPTLKLWLWRLREPG
jgi:hypothetical protein